MIQHSHKRPSRLALWALAVTLGVVSVSASEVDTPEAAIGEEKQRDYKLRTWVFAEEEFTEVTNHFVRSAATAFVQYDDDSTWLYAGGGCISRTGGSEFYDLDLQIPDGVTLDFLRIYFYDNDAANDATAWLYSFDGQGGFTLITTAASSGTPGQSSAGSGFFSHIVDNVSEALAVRIGFGVATTSQLEICGVRLRYTTTP